VLLRHPHETGDQGFHILAAQEISSGPQAVGRPMQAGTVLEHVGELIGNAAGRPLRLG
jgi:hypothetical protein